MPPKTEEELSLEYGKTKYVKSFGILTDYVMNHRYALSVKDLMELWEKDPLAFKIYDARQWKFSQTILDVIGD